jgi:hypothetical protein
MTETLSLSLYVFPKVVVDFPTVRRKHADLGHSFLCLIECRLVSCLAIGHLLALSLSLYIYIYNIQ